MHPKLDLAAARSLILQPGGGEVPDFEKWLRDNYPTLFVIEENKPSGRLTAQLTKPGLRPFAHRMTGGCGKMTENYWDGLNNLIAALSGYSSTGERLPKMTGLGMFGGSRMLFKRDPKVVRPGITEVFPAVGLECPGTIMMGFVTRYSKMFPTEHGLIIGTEPDHDFFTILHPHQKAVALLQQNADTPSPWDVEFLRCSDMIGELHEQSWESLLTVYNGGVTTRKEVLHWARLSQRYNDPTLWRVLLVEGSGGVADELIEDKAWLQDHPNVHVCGCSVAELRDSFYKLGAITL